MEYLLWVFIGIILGTCIGVILMALLNAGKNNWDE